MTTVTLTSFNPFVSVQLPFFPDRRSRNKIERKTQYSLGVEITLAGLTIEKKAYFFEVDGDGEKLARVCLPPSPLCKIDHQISSINISVRAPFPYIHTAEMEGRY